MDWGLFRAKKKENFILRDQMGFSKKFYYFAMILNIFLRFFWLISITTYPYENDSGNNFLKSLEIVVFA